jgi:tagatose 1,6-diphosphate aldolase
MSIPLTPGRWRGLMSTSTQCQAFAVLAFDQRSNYRQLLPAGSTYEDAVQIKYEVVTVLAPHTSAVLLDPEYGLKAALLGVKNSGLLMCIEETGYSGDSTYRRTEFIPGWTVGKIRKMGASAAKLLIYYHPDSGALAEEIEALVTRVAEDCHKYDLPLFVEPLAYSLNASVNRKSDVFSPTLPAVGQETARRLSRTGADVLKLEFPVDAAYNANPGAWRAACEAISAVCAVPWVILSAGIDFATFEKQVQIACQAGASGFLGGRAIWKEAVSMTAAERHAFLTTTGIERLERLMAVAAEYARPWTDFYNPPAAVEKWFTTYAEGQ